ncbi:unnamed protein product [Symbiodinium sp. KB8]|nr:unnamed protein product [Symbiodinium sp. KB8]
MGYLGAKLLYAGLGAGAAATAYYFVQDGVWNRAEVAARGISKMQEQVPGMDTLTKIDRPEVFTSVSSAFQGEFSAHLWNKFVSSWNYGVLSVREGLDGALSSSKDKGEDR